MKSKNKKIIYIPKEENIIDYNEIIKILCENMNNYIKSMYNDAWVYPDESYKPKGFEKVEGGCYWAP